MKHALDYSLNEIQASLTIDESPINHNDIRKLIEQLRIYVEGHQFWARHYQVQKEITERLANVPEPRTTNLVEGTYTDDYEAI